MSRHELPLGWAIPLNVNAKVSLAGDMADISSAGPQEVSLDQYVKLQTQPVDISAIPARIAEKALQDSGVVSMNEAQPIMLPEQKVSAWDTKTMVIIGAVVAAIGGGAYYYHRKHRRGR